MQKKSQLPTKLCVTCARPFTWRKKWEKVWDEVKYCSERCRNEKRGSDKPGSAKPPNSSPTGKTA